MRKIRLFKASVEQLYPVNSEEEARDALQDDIDSGLDIWLSDANDWDVEELVRDETTEKYFKAFEMDERQAMKYNINSSKKLAEFLEVAYNDVIALKKRGMTKACFTIGGDLDIGVTVNGVEGAVNKVRTEIRLTNIDPLDEGMAVTIGSMLYSLIEENNLYEFDYEVVEAQDGDE